MNKSKMMSVALMCALALGACIDDKESASVTALREAKTEYLLAQSEYQKAQAEVARINAEVAKAKAEAEAEVALLKAQAEAAKTQAEADKIKQEAEAAAKKLEIKLAQLEAEAKAAAALAEKQYQEYLNQLAQAQRDAETEKQADLSDIIGKYQVALSNIDGYKKTISEKEFTKLQKEQEKMAVLAGEGPAKVKVDSIKSQHELQQKEAQLRELEVLYEAEAEKRKAIVEEIRSGLDGLVTKVNEAKVAWDNKKDELGDYEKGAKADLKLLQDSLKESHRVLNAAEYNGTLIVKDELTGGVDYLPLGLTGHSQGIVGDPEYFDWWYDAEVFRYYKHEFDRLIADIDVVLADATKKFTAADTLDKVEPKLQKLFDAFEVAEKKYNDAETDLIAKQKAEETALDNWNKVNSDPKATEEDKQKAKTAYDNAVKAREGAEAGVETAGIAMDEAKGNYESYRNSIEGAKWALENYRQAMENYTTLKANVAKAGVVCFDEKLAEAIAAAELKVETLTEEVRELNMAYLEVKGEYDADKEIVRLWDFYASHVNDMGESYSDSFLAQVERKMFTLKGDIETLKVKIANLAEIMKDPEQIVEKYYSTLAQEIETLTNEIATAQAQLDKEQILANEYKATIDAWMSGAAE